MDNLPEALRGLTVRPDLPIIDAVQRLNDAHKRIVLVIDSDGRLEGVVTDSNIRHAILKRIDFSLPVREIMVKTPVTVAPTEPEEAVLRLMEQTTLYQIPVVDAARRLVGIHFLDDLLHGRAAAPERVAVVMAGGLGSRLRPLTDNMPKPLLRVGDKPILFVLLDQLIGLGFNRLYVTINYKGAMVRDAVMAEPRFRDAVELVEEPEPRGTAGALALLPRRPETSFLVLNGDLLTKVAVDEMLRFHELERNAVTVAIKEEQFTVPYGVVQLEGTRITRVDEKPSFGYFLNTGVYVVEPAVLDLVPPDRRIDMTDIVNDALAHHQRVGCFPVHEYWLDIGLPSQLARADADFRDLFAGKRGD